MDPMQISTRHSYAADPATVIKMMADEVWLAEVARRAGASTWRVSADSAGSHVHAELPAPERAKRFTGANLVFDLDIVWQPIRPDGRADGRIDVRIERMPASMHGTGHMIPNGSVTEVDYQAEFNIRVPLVGRSLEDAAAPYVRRVIDTQQDVGNDYLAGRLG